MPTTIIILDWVGAFCLAIEAIKLNNFFKLYNWTGVTFKWVSGDAGESSKYAFTVLAVGTITTIIFGIPYIETIWERWTSLAPEVNQLVMGVALAVSGAVVSYFVGAYIFMAVLLVLFFVAKALEVIENYTTSGAIGVLGFLLISSAAILKLSGYSN